MCTRFLFRSVFIIGYLHSKIKFLCTCNRNNAKNAYLLLRVCLSVCLSVTPYKWNNSVPHEGFSNNLTFEYFSKSLSKKFKFHYNLTRIMDTLHEHQCTFLIISRLFFLRMRNISDKSCTENQNTLFIFSIFFPKIVPFLR